MGLHQQDAEDRSIGRPGRYVTSADRLNCVTLVLIQLKAKREADRQQTFPMKVGDRAAQVSIMSGY